MRQGFSYSHLTAAGIFSIVFMIAATLSAELKPASIFGNNMVLQQGTAVPVWGKAAPGEKVIVEFAGQKKTASADENGKWMVNLDPLKASAQGAVMTISGSSTVKFNNVLVGEVWICSGQSNMQLGVRAVEELKALVPEANKLPIHYYAMPESIAFEKQDDCSGSWQAAPPTSAVAFGFAYFLQKSLGIPIGIIQTCWGSSSIEGWMPIELTEQLPHFKKIMDKFKADKDQQEACRLIIEQYKKAHCIRKYCDDEAKDKELSKKYRNANIFARTRSNMLYNAMLHPVIPYAVRGMVWYQGEANANAMDKMRQYKESLQVWVKTLRSLWGNEKFHFLAVMLPGYGRIFGQAQKGYKDDYTYPGNPTWAWVRESQMGILELPNTAVANTIDLGSLKTIHPKDKKPVCERLALIAEHDVYGKDVKSLAPMFDSFKVDGNKMIIKFKYAEGLKSKDGTPPKGFWIADKEGSWHKADAVIKGDSVVITAKGVDKPAACRYAFAAKPEVNLVNGAGLPVYPFRTDNWKK